METYIYVCVYNKIVLQNFHSPFPYDDVKRRAWKTKMTSLGRWYLFHLIPCKENVQFSLHIVSHF